MCRLHLKESVVCMCVWWGVGYNRVWKEEMVYVYTQRFVTEIDSSAMHNLIVLFMVSIAVIKHHNQFEVGMFISSCTWSSIIQGH